MPKGACAAAERRVGSRSAGVAWTRAEPDGVAASILPAQVAGPVVILADPIHALILLGAGVLAGAGNAIAGGGTTVSFPILVWAGLAPQVANATNTLGLISGSIGGAWSYRERIRKQAGWGRLWIPALLGAAVGAALLLALPSAWFETIAPWLVIGSAVLEACDPLIRRRLPQLRPGERRLGSSFGALFLISIYGGYFGAGIGILVLITLRLAGIVDLHDANGLKNLLVAGIRSVAAAGFIVKGVVAWPAALLMMGGATVGGAAGGWLVQKLDQGTLRWIVVGIGLAMGASMLLD